MYFELSAPTQVAFNRAIWEAETMGLDPESMGSLTFNIGTGSIEKVTNLREKYNLREDYVSEFEPTGYQEKQMSDYREGFEDGVRFAREVIIENIRDWAESSDESEVFDDIADRIEFGNLVDTDSEDE